MTHMHTPDECKETLSDLVRDAHQNSVNKGFWDEQRYNSGQWNYASALKTIPEKLCLIHSEVSEALEDYRSDKMETVIATNSKPEGFPSELADVCIRIFDLAGALDIDLEHEIKLKMEYNATRPHKHGKVC